MAVSNSIPLISLLIRLSSALCTRLCSDWSSVCRSCVRTSAILGKFSGDSLQIAGKSLIACLRICKRMCEHGVQSWGIHTTTFKYRWKELYLVLEKIKFLHSLDLVNLLPPLLNTTSSQWRQSIANSEWIMDITCWYLTKSVFNNSFNSHSAYESNS